MVRVCLIESTLQDDKTISLSSVSSVFLQVVLGLPLFLLPAGVRATLGILSVDIRKTCTPVVQRVDNAIQWISNGKTNYAICWIVLSTLWTTGARCAKRTK